jgi:TonB family protein
MFERLRAQGRSYWGMQLAHLGIAVFVVGVTVVNGYQVERDMRMNVGDTVQVGRYDIKFNGTQKLSGANYTGVRGDIEVSRGGSVVSKMNPEKRIYNVQKMPMTEAAIDTGPWGDIYVSLGDPIEGAGKWSDEPALFPGGNDSLNAFIRKHVQYPEPERRLSKEGEVQIKFLIEKDGTVSDIQIIKVVDGAPGFTRETMQLMRAMPKWKPAKTKGKIVRVYYTLPVKFKLQ